ncbi:MAG: hypothetical protein V1858_00155 [Candidatus Gottesmanbacteria bacterium]
MSEDNKDSNGFWLGLLIGGFLGAAMLMLAGSKEGKKIIEQLLEKGENLGEELQEKLEDSGQKINEVKEATTTKINEVKEQVGNETIERLDNALAKLEEVQGQAQDATEKIRKRFFTQSGRKLS